MMKKILIIILLFIGVSVQAQRFPSVDSLQTYILKYVRNSTVESFTNLRMQNVVFGLSELLSNSTPDSIQVYTTGDTVTVDSSVIVLFINPSTTKDTLTIILPLGVNTKNEVQIYFGGTITADTVVTNLSILANTGQSIIQATVPLTAEAGECLVYRYRLTKWFRKQ